MIKEVGGTRIPAMGLGTWKMRGKECVESVRSALDMGYRHIDTARMYGNEEEVGKAVKNSGIDREDIFITTKIQPSNLDHDSLKENTDDSLRRLQTDYVDLLLIHWPNEAIPVQESLRAMHELKGDGKIKQIGVSNFTVDLLEEAIDVAPDIVCNQVEMHPYLKQKELVDFCQENDLILTAYSPLARGDTIGDEVLGEIGEKHNKTEAQVALRWLIQQENVVAIPKASREKHRKENLGVLGFELDGEDMRKISVIKKRTRKIDPPFSPW